MNTGAAFLITRAGSCRSRRASGIMLIDCLVYIACFFMITGVGFSFFYTCWDGSFALRRNSEDIENGLRAGEIWRSDIRGATGHIRVESLPGAEKIYVPGKSGEIVYNFAGNSLTRTLEGQPARELLSNVKQSRMEASPRQHVTAWRWELELMPVKKRTVRVTPLFTFEAVPVL